MERFQKQMDGLGLRGIFRSGLGTGGRFPDEMEERESDVRHAIPNLAQFRYEPTAW
jgi:hypothetical protein